VDAEHTSSSSAASLSGSGFPEPDFKSFLKVAHGAGGTRVEYSGWNVQIRNSCGFESVVLKVSHGAGFSLAYHCAAPDKAARQKHRKYSAVQVRRGESYTKRHPARRAA
jgi:hypothetical protein